MGNNFEEYRQPWETGPHWELKREFLDRYQDHFSMDRLLCLAQAYSNIVLMQCSYPAPVMQEIHGLSQSLKGCKRFRENQGAAKNSASSSQMEKKRKILPDCEPIQKHKFIKFCESVKKPSKNVEPEEKSLSNMELCVDYASIKHSPDAKIIETLSSEVQKLLMLVKKVEPMDLIQSAVMSLQIGDLFHVNVKYKDRKSSTTTSNSMCYCELIIGATRISVGEGNDAVIAKKKAADYALQVLIKFKSLPTKSLEDVQKVLRGENDIHELNQSLPERQIENNFNSDKHVQSSLIDDTSTSQRHDSAATTSSHAEPDICFLRKFAQELQINQTKLKKASAFVIVSETGRRLSVFNDLVFNITEDLSSPANHRTFVCQFSVKNISISHGKGTGKKKARGDAAENAIKYLLNLLEKSDNSSQTHKTQICEKDKMDMDKLQNATYNVDGPNEVDDQSNCAQSTKKVATETAIKPFIINKRLLNNSFEQQLVLFDTTEVRGAHLQTPGAILSYSTQQCRKTFSFKVEEILPVGTFRADVVLENRVIGSGVGTSGAAAKAEATQSTLEKLRKDVYTIKVKTEDEAGYVISRSKIIEMENETSVGVSEDNIGCKMLKMMGWSGGGIGKTAGITEPITAGGHAFGRGLGYTGESPKLDFNKFRVKLEALLQDYSQLKEIHPLIFSADFLKAERALIHRTATKYNLSSNSLGKFEARQLYIRRKIKTTELLDSIVQAGGSTDKYELVDLSN